MRPFDDIERDIADATDPDALLLCGEEVLEHWVRARGEEPTGGRREGFRLLALHRQGAKGDPSFNACRETCRELIYRRNMITAEPDHPETVQRLRLAALVAKHLGLFVRGKLEEAKLGEFCCAARPIRDGEMTTATRVT